MNKTQAMQIRHIVANGDFAALIQVIEDQLALDLQALETTPPDAPLYIARLQASIQAFRWVINLPEVADRIYRNEDN